MQINNVLEQLESDGHYDLAAFLSSHLEGLKGEVTRMNEELRNKNDDHEDALRQLGEEQSESDRLNAIIYDMGLEVERYRTTLEEIRTFKKGDALTYVQQIKRIADKALQGSEPC